MPTKNTTATALRWHPSLKKVFKDCDLWWQNNMVKRNKLEEERGVLSAALATPGLFNSGAGTLQMISHAYASGACTTEAIKDHEFLGDMFQRAVQFRALDFRELAVLSLHRENQPLLAFQTSMRAAGPVLLSQWKLAEACAKVLIDVAEKDLRVNPAKSSQDRWRRGSNDAFLIYLLAEAFDLETTYRPSGALMPEYQAVLDVWRTDDESAFCQAMQAAAEFHISRSRGSTNKMDYEFEYNFDRVYPAELLTVQALRRRIGAAEYSVGHLLIDTPWQLIHDMPAASPDPFAVAAEARLRADYPSFR